VSRDVEFGEGHPQAVASAVALFLVWSVGGEAGHREGQDVAAGAAQPVHRPGRDDQRVGGVQAAGDPDDDLRMADRAQPLLQPGHLDVVGLVAVLLPAVPGRPARRGSVPPRGAARCRRRRVKGELHPAERRSGAAAWVSPRRCRAGGDCRRRCPAAAAPERSRSGSTSATLRRRAVGEALGLGQQPAVLVDHRLPVPGQVGGRLALSRSGVDVAGQAARDEADSTQELAVLGAADGDRAAGQVGQHGGTGQRGLAPSAGSAPTCPRRSPRAARSPADRRPRTAGRARTAPRRPPPGSSPRMSSPGANWRRS
jgi:hypothetical protein